MTGRYKTHMHDDVLEKHALHSYDLKACSKIVCVCVCSDGNLATKQVVFLQRPVRNQAAGQPRNQVRRRGRQSLKSVLDYNLI